jgi:hypothetical protein
VALEDDVGEDSRASPTGRGRAISAIGNGFMILVDVNLLVYVVNADSPFHAKALAWWETRIQSGESVGLSWNSIYGFLRFNQDFRKFAGLRWRNPLDKTDSSAS